MVNFVLVRHNSYLLFAICYLVHISSYLIGRQIIQRSDTQYTWPGPIKKFTFLRVPEVREANCYFAFLRSKAAGHGLTWRLGRARVTDGGVGGCSIVWYGVVW